MKSTQAAPTNWQIMLVILPSVERLAIRVHQRLHLHVLGSLRDARSLQSGIMRHCFAPKLVQHQQRYKTQIWFRYALYNHAQRLEPARLYRIRMHSAHKTPKDDSDRACQSISACSTAAKGLPAGHPEAGGAKQLCTSLSHVKR